MSDLQKGITVFTPTYNRSKTLVRLYESLIKQPSEYFEWLVVDDGSTDNTNGLIEKFRKEEKIKIRYIYKENGGKHTALNVGIENAEREYFMCVDSDDFVAKDGIKALVECIDRFHPEGIIAYKKELGKEGIIGKEFPENLEYSTFFNLAHNLECGGERTFVHSTVLLKDIHIPEPKGQKFFPETYLYDRFDEKYTCFLLRENICNCEYMEGGYSANFRMLMIRNALSMKWFYAERIDLASTVKQRFTFAFRYDAYAMLARSKEGKYKGKHKAMLVIAFPAGLAMYIVYSMYKKKHM